MTNTEIADEIFIAKVVAKYARYTLKNSDYVTDKLESYGVVDAIRKYTSPWVSHYASSNERIDQFLKARNLSI